MELHGGKRILGELSQPDNDVAAPTLLEQSGGASWYDALLGYAHQIDQYDPLYALMQGSYGLNHRLLAEEAAAVNTHAEVVTDTKCFARTWLVDQAPSVFSGVEERTVGFAVVIFASFLSALGGVAAEKVLKNAHVGIWVRNFQMSTASLMLACIPLILKKAKAVATGSGVTIDFLSGFTSLTWFTVLYNSFGGLLVAAVLKFSDVVTKDIAQAFATVLTTAVSLFWLKEIVFNYGVVVGVFLVVFSALFFSGAVKVEPFLVGIGFIDESYLTSGVKSFELKDNQLINKEAKIAGVAAKNKNNLKTQPHACSGCVSFFMSPVIMAACLLILLRFQKEHWWPFMDSDSFPYIIEGSKVMHSSGGTPTLSLL